MCAVFGFCKTQRFNYDSPPPAPAPVTGLQSVEDPDYCTDCKAFIGDVQKMLMNKTTQVGLPHHV